MENFRNPYLNRKIEPVSSSINKMNNPDFHVADLCDHEWQKSGKIEFKKDETELMLEYSTPKFAELFRLAVKAGIISIDGINLLQKSFKMINQLKLQNQKSIFNLYDKLPDGYRVFFNPYSEAYGESRIDIKEKIIFLKDSPISARGLLALFHEVGHEEVDNQKGNLPYDYRSAVSNHRRALSEGTFNKTSQYSGELVLKDERDAWAVALKNIRNFMKDLDIEEVDTEKFIHNNCLQSYSDFIREQIVKVDLKRQQYT